jgi:signal transduction histidine kinase
VDAPTIDELRCEIEELRTSCARMLTAADEQRRSVERELHDGAMQHLVALGVKLQLAGLVVENDSYAATKILDEMLHDVHEALDDVRRLAWRIYPSLLLDRGLGEALLEAASLAGIPARVDAVDGGRLAPELEASIYFCCVELFQQAGEADGNATVRVRTEHDTVRFEVTFESADAAVWKERDLSSVADRLRAFGGRLVVDAGQVVCISGVVQGAGAAPCSSAR